MIDYVLHFFILMITVRVWVKEIDFKVNWKKDKQFIFLNKAPDRKPEIIFIKRSEISLIVPSTSVY